MLFAIELFELGCTAYKALSGLVKSTLDLLGKVAVSETDSQLFRVHETRARKADQSVALGRTTCRSDVVDPDRSVEKDRVVIRTHVGEDSIVSVRFDHLWQVEDCATAVAKMALAPRVWMSIFVNTERSIVAAFDLVLPGKVVARDVS